MRRPIKIVGFKFEIQIHTKKWKLTTIYKHADVKKLEMQSKSFQQNFITMFNL